jgi:acetyl esterase/lipase
MKGSARAALLGLALVTTLGFAGSAAAGAASQPVAPVSPCSVGVLVGDPTVCSVPEPGPGDTIPEGYDAGAQLTFEGVQYGPDPADLLDLYRPVSDTRAPVIVFFHPGGWVSGTRTTPPQSLLRQVARGYAVVSADYRLAPAVHFPVPLQDAKTAVRWVKAHANEYGLRANKVFVAGASAGGHLAAMVALTPGLFEPTDLPPDLAKQNSRVVGAMSEVGPLDLAALNERVGTWGPGLVAQFLGCPAPALDEPAPCTPEQLAEASPTHYVTRSAPPMYLSYGTLDALVPPDVNAYPLARRFAELRVGQKAAVDEVPQQGHNLDVDGLNVTKLEAWFDGIRDTAPRTPSATRTWVSAAR